MVRRREIKKKELLEVFKRELLLKLARSCKPSHTMESVFGSSADWIVNELNFTETREQYSNMVLQDYQLHLPLLTQYRCNDGFCKCILNFYIS